ncbi:MAG TPA: DUF4142 domain-containing protein [Cyclobacteriaceae bacterium]|nr:DUF4142 domain-containing protein [Cyclobacteriaceae bacterium]
MKISQKKNLSRYLLLAVVTLSIAGCEKDDAKPVDPLNEQDKNFAVDATYSNLAETRMGQLAMDKGANLSVREFGEMMVTEHTEAQDQLALIAESLDILLPDTLATEQRVLHEQLSLLEDEAFDSAYISSQITAHREAQQIFQRQIDQGLNSRLHAYASNTLLKINLHLENALDLESEFVPE